MPLRRIEKTYNNKTYQANSKSIMFVVVMKFGEEYKPVRCISQYDLWKAAKKFYRQNENQWEFQEREPSKTKSGEYELEQGFRLDLSLTHKFDWDMITRWMSVQIVKQTNNQDVLKYLLKV